MGELAGFEPVNSPSSGEPNHAMENPNCVGETRSNQLWFTGISIIAICLLCNCFDM